MRGTDGPDDDSQQGPEHADARPRADSSAVDRRSTIARADVADLEPTTDELDRKRARTAPHSQDRQPRNRCQTCLKHESGKRARKLHRGNPPTARYKARSARTAAFSRKTVHSNKQQGKRRRNSASSRGFIQQNDGTAKFKSVGTAACVQCKREAS